MKYSIIFLINEENACFFRFVNTIGEIFASRGESYEILLIANGTENILKRQMGQINVERNVLRAFALNRRASEAACVRWGLSECAGRIIMTCGSYQELSRESFITLLECQTDQFDVTIPKRINRVDPYFSRLHSKLFNFVVRKITGSDLNDIGCNTKLFRREVFENLEISGNMYRFLPIIALSRGYRVREVECDYYRDYRGRTFYNVYAYLVRIIDILTVYFNTRYSRKPLRFFSSIGLIFMILGFLLLAGIVGEWILFDAAIGNRPSLIIGLIFIVLGTQVGGIGLLGEIIAFAYGRNKPEYTVEKIIE
jgi:hypothetical protein